MCQLNDSKVKYLHGSKKGKGLTSKILSNNALLEHSVAEPTKHRVLLKKIDAVKYFFLLALQHCAPKARAY